MINGFQVAELSPFTLVATATACALVARFVVGVQVNVAEPVVAEKPLIKY